MNSRFTHFGTEAGVADLLAGNVIPCEDCGRILFRDHAFISDAESETAGEPTSVDAQLALGRAVLPDNAERVDEGAELCEECELERSEASGSQA